MDPLTAASIVVWILLIPWAGLIFFGHVIAVQDISRRPEGRVRRYQWFANFGVDVIAKTALVSLLVWGLSRLIYEGGGCTAALDVGARCAHLPEFVGQLAFLVAFFLGFVGSSLGLPILALAMIFEFLTRRRRRKTR